MPDRFSNIGTNPDGTPILRKWTAEENARRDAEEAEASARTKAERALAYRQDRAAAYARELGEQPGFEQAIGDTLDAVIKAQYGDRSELDALVEKIATIKARFPKPGE